MDSYDNLSDSVQAQIDELIKQVIVTRKRKKITQIQLSKMSGIPQATISRLESFKVKPSLFVLIKIATVLGLSLVFK